MKKNILLLLFAGSTYFANAQLITNGDFETDVTTYTVAESTTKVLKRVAGIYDATTQTTNPTLTASDAVATGQWVKRAPADVLAKGVILASGGHTASCLNLKIGINSAVTGYNNSFAMLAVQRLTGLANDKRYLVSFWAKQDGTANNRCVGVNVVLGDNVVKSTTVPLTVGAMLTGGTAWTQYTVVLDIPKYVASNPTADFTTAEFGFAITTPIVSSKTNYAGVLIDDVVMTELTTPTVAYVKPVATGTGDGSSWENASADIQTAINSLTYGEVRVAAGTYTPSATLVLKDGVNLIGAYAADGSGTRDVRNNKTILDGAGTKRLIMNSSSSNPFKYTTMVNGFILQNGYSDLGSAASLSLGTALENCIIRNNTGTTKGAAVYFNRNTSITGSGYSTNFQATGSLINCLIINNTSASGAGAVYGESNTLFGLVNCVIANNYCSDVAATSTGGVYIGSSAQWSHLQNCILYNNFATKTLSNAKSVQVTLSATLNNWFSDAAMPITVAAKTGSVLSELNKTATNVAGPDFELPTSFQGATTDPVKLAEYETCNWRLKSTSGLIGLGNKTQNVRVPYENINAILVVTTGGRAYSNIGTDIMGSDRVINTTNDLGAYEYNPVIVTAANSGNGAAAGDITVSKGTTVALTSIPESGYRLADWTNDATVVSTSPTYTFIPETNSTIQANFASNTVNVGAATNASSLVNCENCDVTVTNGGTLTIDETKTVNSLAVSGGGRVDNTSATAKTLTVTNNLTLDSDGNGTGTYVEKNNGALSVGGTTTVNQKVTSAETGLLGRNWYVSSPVTAATSATITDLTGNGLVSYNESTGLWEDAGTTMQVAKGYIIKSPNAEKTVSFSGTGGLNTGNLSTDFESTSTLTRSGANKGFNLIGNPYPSYISWDGTTKTNVGTSIWYRSKKTGSYVVQTYNVSGAGVGTLGGTNLIPPLQAFWVRVDADKTTGTVEFTNTIRTHQDQNNSDNRLKAKSATAQKLLRLQVSNQVNADEAVIYFNENALDEFDTFDSPKMTNGDNTIPEIYTSVGSNQLVINGMNSIESNSLIPLGFKTGANNNFTIKATEIVNFDADTKILLVDNELNTEKDITNGAAYSFSSDVANNANRFSILFRSTSIVSGIDNVNNRLYVNIYRNAANQITINSNSDELGMVFISNALGQKILSTPSTGLNTIINKPIGSGVYFVTLLVAGNSTTQKVIIN